MLTEIHLENWGRQVMLSDETRLRASEDALFAGRRRVGTDRPWSQTVRRRPSAWRRKAWKAA
nr:hypothetical protein [Enterobacter sp. CC120223-11]